MDFTNKKMALVSVCFTKSRFGGSLSADFEVLPPPPWPSSGRFYISASRKLIFSGDLILNIVKITSY